MSERWLRCEIRKGMFSDERVVLLTTPTGEVAAFFVPREWVEGTDRDGRVKVRTFKEDSRAWAIVPNESQTIVAVDESQFVNA